MRFAKPLAAAGVLALVAWCIHLSPLLVSAGLVVVVLLAVLYLYFVFFAPPGQVSSTGEIRNHKWHAVSLGSPTISGDGSTYALYVKLADSDNLLIHFSGGGACWDDHTASRPITVLGVLGGYSRQLKVFYFTSLTRLFPAALAGITSRAKKNAFHDWNVVFVPYTTGDLHIGDATNTYSRHGKTFSVHHNGRPNVSAALSWVFENFAGTGKTLVSGESSGAWAAAFYAPLVADRYADRKIYCLSDGAGIVSRRWQEILGNVWKVNAAHDLGFTIGTDIFEDALMRRQVPSRPNIKYLHSNTLYDDTLTRFDAALNGASVETDQFIDDWAANTKGSMRRLSESDLDYHYFLTDWGHNTKRHTTQHTMVTNELYNTCEAEGVFYAQWLKRNIIDDENLSVGRHLLN